MSSIKAAWLLGASAAALAVAAPAMAQDAAPAPAPAAPAASEKPGAVLQEIVVTADRKNSFSADLVQAGSFRGARQLDTPLTISVMPRELLLTQQAAGLLDALKNTAGVTSAQTAPTVYNNLSIRGIAVDNRGNYRLNGSLPIVNLIDLPLEDKDRVE
ncbi:MAG TPA: Plug domain-containing protein, partial [Caulobacteraceae bacterium]